MLNTENAVRNRMNEERDLRSFLPALEQELINLYREMAPELKEKAGQPDSIEEKEDGSFVTCHDQDVEREVFSLMHKIMPEALCLGEESHERAVSDPEDAFSIRFVVILDPIDGTHSFIKGEAHKWTSGFGLCENTEKGLQPVYGCLFLPDEGERGKLIVGGINGIREVDLKDTATRTINKERRQAGEVVRFSSLPEHGGMRIKPERVSEVDSGIAKDVSVADMTAVVRGEADAALVSAKIWDIAGCLAAGSGAGLGLLNISTGEFLKGLSVDDFMFSDPMQVWRVAQPFVFCHKNDADRMFGLVEVV